MQGPGVRLHRHPHQETFMVTSNKWNMREQDILDALEAAIEIAESMAYGVDRDLWEGRRLCLSVVRRCFRDEWPACAG
jgi:hypothetical protein